MVDFHLLVKRLILKFLNLFYPQKKKTFKNDDKLSQTMKNNENFILETTPYLELEFMSFI